MDTAPLIKDKVESILLSTNQEYTIENNTFPIPTNFDSKKLNKLIQKMLTSKETFNFFIHSKLLESTLDDYFIQNPEVLKSTSEKILEIYYTPQMKEPQLSNTIKEDEWIRKISVRNLPTFNSNNVEYYCVGLFNSEVTLYNHKYEKLLKIDEEKDKSYCELLHDMIFFNNDKNNIIIKCSRNDDENLKVFSVDMNKMTYSQIYTHNKEGNEYFNSLSLNPVDFFTFCAGDTESNLHILKINDIQPVNKSSKKRKTDIHNVETLSIIEKCHVGEVRQVKWINNQQILTSGDDFLVKLWNVNTKTNYSSYNLNYKLCTSLTHIPTTEMFLTGQEDGKIKSWDIRQTNIANVYSGHSYAVSDVVVLPGSQSNFASVGYDGKIKIWDVRSTKKSIHEVQTSSEKLYSLAFNTKEMLLTGGDSSSVDIYKL
jgi:WD40 repeat protein